MTSQSYILGAFGGTSSLSTLRVPTKPNIVRPETPRHGFLPVRNLGTQPPPAHAGVERQILSVVMVSLSGSDKSVGG